MAQLLEENTEQLLCHLIGDAEGVKALQLTLTGQEDLLSCCSSKFLISDIVVDLGAAAAS